MGFSIDSLKSGVKNGFDKFANSDFGNALFDACDLVADTEENIAGFVGDVYDDTKDFVSGDSTFGEYTSDVKEDAYEFSSDMSEDYQDFKEDFNTDFNEVVEDIRRTAEVTIGNVKATLETKVVSATTTVLDYGFTIAASTATAIYGVVESAVDGLSFLVISGAAEVVELVSEDAADKMRDFGQFIIENEQANEFYDDMSNAYLNAMYGEDSERMEEARNRLYGATHTVVTTGVTIAVYIGISMLPGGALISTIAGAGAAANESAKMAFNAGATYDQAFACAGVACLVSLILGGKLDKLGEASKAVTTLKGTAVQVLKGGTTAALEPVTNTIVSYFTYGCELTNEDGSKMNILEYMNSTGAWAQIGIAFLTGGGMTGLKTGYTSSALKSAKSKIGSTTSKVASIFGLGKSSSSVDDALDGVKNVEVGTGVGEAVDIDVSAIEPESLDTGVAGATDVLDDVADGPAKMDVDADGVDPNIESLDTEGLDAGDDGVSKATADTTDTGVKEAGVSDADVEKLKAEIEAKQKANLEVMQKVDSVKKKCDDVLAQWNENNPAKHCDTYEELLTNYHADPNFHDVELSVDEIKKLRKAKLTRAGRTEDFSIADVTGGRSNDPNNPWYYAQDVLDSHKLTAGDYVEMQIPYAWMDDAAKAESLQITKEILGKYTDAIINGEAEMPKFVKTMSVDSFMDKFLNKDFYDSGKTLRIAGVHSFAIEADGLTAPEIVDLFGLKYAGNDFYDGIDGVILFESEIPGALTTDHLRIAYTDPDCHLGLDNRSLASELPSNSEYHFQATDGKSCRTNADYSAREQKGVKNLMEMTQAQELMSEGIFVNNSSIPNDSSSAAYVYSSVDNNSYKPGSTVKVEALDGSGLKEVDVSDRSYLNSPITTETGNGVTLNQSSDLSGLPDKLGAIEFANGTGTGQPFDTTIGSKIIFADKNGQRIVLGEMTQGGIQYYPEGAKWLAERGGASKLISKYKTGVDSTRVDGSAIANNTD